MYLILHFTKNQTPPQFRKETIGSYSWFSRFHFRKFGYRSPCSVLYTSGRSHPQGIPYRMGIILYPLGGGDLIHTGYIAVMGTAFVRDTIMALKYNSVRHCFRTANPGGYTTAEGTCGGTPNPTTQHKIFVLAHKTRVIFALTKNLHTILRCAYQLGFPP